jgi:alpha-tubulin suppressor-like RCC1 family protein
MLVVLAMLALVAVQKAGATLAPGRLYGWGDNDSGQATVPAGEDFIRVSAGAQHSLALKIDHTVVG